MKKEYLIVTTVGLLLFAQALDYFSGFVRLNILNPTQFLNPEILKHYPMTAVSIFSRAFGLMLFISLILSLISKKYFQKVIISLILAFIAEIYAFQQLATGAKMTTTVWTLSISYAGAMMIIPIIIFIVLGIIEFLIPQPKNTTTFPNTEENKPKDTTSVLNP